MYQPALVDLTSYRDGRGALSVIDSWDSLPFAPVRLFWVTDVPEGVRRGGHAAMEGHELLVCLTGSCTVDTEWASGHQTFVLDQPDRGLHLPPGVWMTYGHAARATALLVLASNAFDPTSVVTDHAAFVAGVRAR